MVHNLSKVSGNSFFYTKNNTLINTRKKLKKYTKEDIKFITSCVEEAKNNHSHIKNAFEKASKHLNRHIKAVEAMWYRTTNDKNFVKKFTEEEDHVIINNIKNFPTNLKYAFKISSEDPLLKERSLPSIAQRWYGHLRRQTNIHSVSCGSKNGFTQNVKNVLRDENSNLPNQGLKHHLYLIKEILDLSEKERNAIITILTI